MDQPIIEKTCTRCGQNKPADLKHFPASKKNKDGLNSWCRKCYREKSAAWSAKNPEKKAATAKTYRASLGPAYYERKRQRYASLSLSEKERRKRDARAHNDKLKREALEHYGGAFCRCCGETELLMLALDHIENDGASHRKSLTGSTRKLPTVSHVWAKRNNWPLIFQVTCFNCNWARHWNNGVCPHQEALPKVKTSENWAEVAAAVREKIRRLGNVADAFERYRDEGEPFLGAAATS